MVARPSAALVAGVDGGQSSTVAAVAEAATGRELGRGVGPPADLVGEAPGSTRQAEALVTAIHAALRAAGFGEDAPVEAIVAGVTGFEAGDAVPALPFPGARVRVVHDGLTAHAGALDGAPGIVVIAGTGSVVLGTGDVGGSVRAGGWGFLFGDEGSAFAIGRAAIAAAMRAEDGRLASVAGTLVAAHFAARSLREVQAGFAAGTIGRPEIAALAPAVIERSPDDAVASAIVRDAISELVATVRAVDRRLPPGCGPRAVSYAGGLFKSPVYTATFRALLEAQGTTLRLVAPIGDGARGAVRLAQRLAADAVVMP